MQELIESIFGTGKDLTTLQMMARAVVMFFITLILIRLGGVRMFGKKSSFDDIIVIMLGAILSRAVVGASPLGATVAAAASMIIIHRLIALLCIRSKSVESLIKGKATLLYKDGKILYKNLYKCSLSENDLYESLRLETKKTSLEDVAVAYMENNGRVSFVMKE